MATLSTEQFTELLEKFTWVTALKTFFEGIRSDLEEKKSDVDTAVENIPAGIQAVFDENQTSITYTPGTINQDWLIAPNFKGDSDVTLSTVVLGLKKTGRFVDLSVYVDITDFSALLTEDGVLGFYLDIGAIAKEGGIFESVVSGGVGQGYMLPILDGVGFYSSITSSIASITSSSNEVSPNQMYFSIYNSDVQNEDQYFDRATFRCNFFIEVEEINSDSEV